MSSTAGHPHAQRSDSDEAVTTLFRFAALAAHPDRPGGDVATMAKVNAAAELLRRGSTPTALGPCGIRPVEADVVMPWGKHRGRPMGELPLGYLGWLAEDVDDPRLRTAARRIAHWRTSS